jgi:hypothetical protein
MKSNTYRISREMKENNQALCLKLMIVDLNFEVEWAALLKVKRSPNIFLKNSYKKLPKKVLMEAFY